MQHSNMKFLISLLALLVITAGPMFALAQTPGTTNPPPTPGTTNPPPTGGTENPDPTAGTSNPATALVNPLGNIDSLEALVNEIMKAVVRIGSIFLTLAIIWVGFKFVVAQGNEEKLQEARGAFVWVVIGGLILLGAQAISLVIQQTVEGLG